jgi:hypothetical protein
MPLRLSRNRLYQVGAVLLLPVAGYNFVVWFSNPETKWEQAYLKALIGGISCLITSIILVILSFTRQDRQIVLCDTR